VKDDSIVAVSDLKNSLTLNNMSLSASADSLVFDVNGRLIREWNNQREKLAFYKEVFYIFVEVKKMLLVQ